MNTRVIQVVVLVVIAVCVSGQKDGYELDPVKVEQRYNIIQSIVGKGIPYGSHAAHKPKIGQGYRGYKAPAPYSGFKPAPVIRQTYTPYNQNNQNSQYNQYNQPRQARGYNNVAAYKPVAPAYPSTYPNRFGGVSVPNRPSGYDGASGYQFGGGRVHPIFNNELLYKPKPATNNDLGSYANTDPIFIGGNVGSKLSPNRIDFYGVRAPGTKAYAGVRDALIPASYTAPSRNLYGNLPGYSNTLFRNG